MFIFGTDIPLHLDEFRLLRDFIYQHCGLFFADDAKYLLEKRLNKRLDELHLEHFRDYYYQLRYGQHREQEMAAALDLLTTNETYFFREDFQLRTFTEDVVPELVEYKKNRRTRHLRIWSAGCSSGEEPYTLAMLLLEHPLLAGWDIEIIGTDISQRVLKTAREGLYGQNSFRVISQARLQRYFTPAGQKWQLADEVKRLVRISHLNLFDQNRVALLGEMDAIFCRNVIIYFDLEAKKRVIRTLHDCLRPGGYLLLGHSESLMSISTDFTLKHFEHDMLYQKPAITTIPTEWQR
ncbi:MAG: protein-glutamate O-methyltransferase CheR [Deltaproteobacteria bacterium]|nr:protein-glutamate O-methyltransferase CheR [Deltaproteobacteria bacterium]NCP03819.1 protein-glutamate O-methyltransferase CheR [Deltaproteobacteria bacterium]